MGGNAKYRHSDDASIGNWGYQHGSRAPRVTIKERPSRGPENQPALYARWYVNSNPVGPFKVRSVTTVRDEGGKVDKDRRQAAEDEAERIWDALQAGTSPDVIMREHPEPVEDDDADDETPPEELTLREGWDLALDEDEGAFITAKDEWMSQRERHAEIACSLLGEDFRWVDLTPGKVNGLLKKMRDHYADHPRDDVTGIRITENTVSGLKKVRDFLMGEEAIPSDVPAWPANWKDKLDQLFRQEHGDDVEPYRPFHSQIELDLIGQAVWNDSYDLDPRWRMMLKLGLGQRLGAVNARATRTELKLNDAGAWEMGRLTIPRARTKEGIKIDLRPETRKMIDTALEDGYLSRLEKAYQQGDVDDYHLFPAGRLRKGKARPDKGGKPICDSWLKDQLHDLEKQIFDRNPQSEIWDQEQRDAGTMHKHQRGWHGLRRAMKKRFKDRDVPAEERNEALGWVQGSRVPERIYSDPEDEDRIERASRSREAILAEFAGEDQKEDAQNTDSADSTPSVKALLYEFSDAVTQGDLQRAAELKARVDELREGR